MEAAKKELNNVEIADSRVDFLRKMIVSAGSHKIVPISVANLLNILESAERLAALERHLYNLTSNTYKIKAQPTQPVPTQVL